MEQTETLRLSIIIVTYNPRSDILSWALDGIEEQTLDRSDYEVVVVDNNSFPPLIAEDLNKGRTLPLRVVREERQGITFARYRGILEAKSDLIVFVDDDNRIHPGYLENALRIAAENPKLGAFGGKIFAKMEDDIPEWKKVFIEYLGVRNYGEEAIISNEDRWGEWEPAGAGMVLRKQLAMAYVKFIDDFPVAKRLGRKGSKTLLSCDDSLIARLGYRIGYYCSYQPVLQLDHFMKKGRFDLRYLMKLMQGYGRSLVILEEILGKSHACPSFWESIIDLYQKMKFRIKTQGKAGLIMWFWDLGWNRQLRHKSKTMRS